MLVYNNKKNLAVSSALFLSLALHFGLALADTQASSVHTGLPIAQTSNPVEKPYELAYRTGGENAGLRAHRKSEQRERRVERLERFREQRSDLPQAERIEKVKMHPRPQNPAARSQL